MVPEKTWKNPLDSKHMKPVNPKGNQPWIFIGRTEAEADAEAEAAIPWPPDVKNWLTGEDSDAGKDWWQKEKGVEEDEVVKWNHRLNGRESEQTLGDREGQRGLAYYSPWLLKESDALPTEQRQAQ